MHRGPNALLLGRDPDRLGRPPFRLHAARRIGIVEFFFQRRVPERVADDAVAFGMQPGDEGVVVWERDAREAWEHVLWRDAVVDEGE